MLKRFSLAATWALVISLYVGCSKGPAVAPVSGTVTYNGEPLQFGAVMFQPDQGQPARGWIQSDGSFVMSTFEEGDGAIVGRHKVRITCFESQRDPDAAKAGDQALGKSLIPKKYNLYEQSGLTIEVLPKDNPTATFTLSDDS